ncbi:hypothetical protein NKY44_30265 [Sinorhizobium meliloti]|uniref:hypothetical protein n=1 Tax=Rhizobium meliloti TaxID=382 RepID=UPI003D657BC4
MTCIAYERKTGLMVADSRATCGGSGRHPIGAKTKIYEIAAGRYKGALLGVSSDVPGMGEALKEWRASGVSVLSVLAAIQVRFDLTIAKRMRWRTIHKRAQGNPYMRSSPKETATAAIPIHRVHPPSFWKGMILAATVIVLVPSSQVSAEDKGQGGMPCL